MREQHRLPDMQVRYTAKKGFFFQLGSSAGGGRGRGGRGGRGGSRQRHPLQLLEEEEESVEMEAEEQSMLEQDSRRGGQHQQQGALRVPPGFSVLQRSGRAVHITTPELNALNVRLRDTSNDCMVLTEQVGCGAAGQNVPFGKEGGRHCGLAMAVAGGSGEATADV